VESELLDVVAHSHYFERIPTDENVLAEGRRTGPVAIGQRAADDRDTPRGFAIRVVEFVPAKRDAHDPEVTRRDDSVMSLWNLVSGRFRLADHAVVLRREEPAQWQQRDRGGFANRGQRPHAAWQRTRHA